MPYRKEIPDKVSASLDEKLATIIASFLDNSEEYDSYSEIVRDALWEKLQEEYGTSDVIEHYISIQKEEVRRLEGEKQVAERELKKERKRLEQLRTEFEATVDREADELLSELEDAEIERK